MIIKVKLKLRKSIEGKLARVLATPGKRADRESGFGSGPMPSAIAGSLMNLVIKARELEKLGLWEKFIEIRKIRNSTGYLWGCIERDEFELTKEEIKLLKIDIVVDHKHYEDLGVTVTSKCCNTRFSIYVRDVDNFWFCPSCGDKLDIH